MTDAEYPHAGGRIAASTGSAQTWIFGFDHSDPGSGAPVLISPQTHSDTMTYCDPYWISDYTFNHLLQTMTAAPTAAGMSKSPTRTSTPGDWLIATGVLGPSAAMSGFGFVRRTDTVADASPPVPGGFTLSQVNAAGDVLASHGFTARRVADSDSQLAFILVVPFASGTAELRITNDVTGALLASRAVSATAPTITSAVAPNAAGPIEGVFEVSWTADDPDGDRLSFDLHASHDGGETYRPVRLSIAGTSVEIDARMLAGGSVILRVVASDGVHSTSRESVPFDVAINPPGVTIVTPVDGYRAEWNQLVTFEGSAIDLLDGSLTDSAYRWANQYGALGTGRVLPVERLPVGANVVTLTVTNSRGAAASRQITVLVEDVLGPRPAKISVTPQALAWHVGNDALEPLTAILAVRSTGPTPLLVNVTSDRSWLTVNGTGELSGLVTPFDLQVSARPATLPPGQQSIAEILVQGVTDPANRARVAVALGKGNTFHQTGRSGALLELRVTSSGMFEIGESLQASWSNAPGNPLDWIGVHRLGETPGIDPALATGNAGQVVGSLDLGDLPAGYYVAAMYEDGTFIPLGSQVPFAVNDPVSPLSSLSIRSMSITSGEALRIGFSGAPGIATDYIAVFAAAAIPGRDSPLSTVALDGATSGHIELQEVLEPGEYVLALFIGGTTIVVSNPLALLVVSSTPSPIETVPPILLLVMALWLVAVTARRHRR